METLTIVALVAMGLTGLNMVLADRALRRMRRLAVEMQAALDQLAPRVTVAGFDVELGDGDRERVRNDWRLAYGVPNNVVAVQDAMDRGVIRK